MLLLNIAVLVSAITSGLTVQAAPSGTEVVVRVGDRPDGEIKVSRARFAREKRQGRPWYQRTTTTTPARTTTTPARATTTTAARTTTTSAAPAPSATGDAALATAVLNEHNRFRALHAAPAMTWSDSLASAAATWASKCVFQHSQGAVGYVTIYSHPIEHAQLVLHNNLEHHPLALQLALAVVRPPALDVETLLAPQQHSFASASFAHYHFGRIAARASLLESCRHHDDDGTGTSRELRGFVIRHLPLFARIPADSNGGIAPPAEPDLVLLFFGRSESLHQLARAGPGFAPLRQGDPRLVRAAVC